MPLKQKLFKNKPPEKQNLSKQSFKNIEKTMKENTLFGEKKAPLIK